MATVPRLQRYYRSATTSCSRMSFGLLISPAGSAGVCRGSYSPERSRRHADLTTGRGLDCSRWPSPLQRPCPRARAGSPRFPGDPSRDFAPVHDPGDDPLRLATDGASGAAPGHLTPKASSLYRFRGYRDASSPAVYASRRASPHAMQDSLPAGGLRLCRAGVEPAGSLREVSDHLILLSRAFPGAINVPLGRGDPSSGSSSSSNRGCIRGPVTPFDLRYGRAHGGSGR